MTTNSNIANQIHDRIVQLGLEPVFCLGDVIFYNTKNFFKKHNFGRDVKRFVQKNDWCIYNNKYHLNARGIITLGFAKKHNQVQEMVWATLQLPACNANLEPNQYIPDEDEEELAKSKKNLVLLLLNLNPLYSLSLLYLPGMLLL